jgi:hypothetical protein
MNDTTHEFSTYDSTVVRRAMLCTSPHNKRSSLSLVSFFTSDIFFYFFAYHWFLLIESYSLALGPRCYVL